MIKKLFLFALVLFTSCQTTKTTTQATQTPWIITSSPQNTPTPVFTPTPTLGIGSSMVSEIDGMTLMYVPAGEFLMGSTADDPWAETDEFPQHTIYLNAFWIDQTEVTNTQYRLCVESGACSESTNEDYYDTQYSDHPVTRVNWYSAQSYCQWAGRELPTEAQWEKAARGEDGRVYPWGNTFERNLLNFCDKNCTSPFNDLGWDDGYADTSPVGSFKDGASPYGALDMAGNVLEWTADWYGEGYYALSPAENPNGPVSGDYKIFRGGSYCNNVPWMRTSFRQQYPPSVNFGIDNVGFRCALPASSIPVIPTAITAESDEDALPASQTCQIAFSSDRDGDNEIFVMDTDGSNQTQLTLNSSNDYSPDWSPDGKHIAFSSNRDGDPEIYVMDADGSNSTQLTFIDGNDMDPDWSPDGKHIAFSSSRNGSDDIYVMDTDGSNPTRLTFTGSSDAEPVWSPDGKRIAFSSDSLKDEYLIRNIYVMDADGSDQIQLTFNDSLDWMPDWSPDGRRIVFFEMRAGIVAIDADGSNQTIIILVDEFPAWSPDGKNIAFVSQRGEGDDEIFVMDADRSNQIQLTFNDSDDGQPAWSPLCFTQ